MGFTTGIPGTCGVVRTLNVLQSHGTDRNEIAIVNMVTYAEERPAKRRDVYLPNAYVAVVDQDAPEILSVKGPTGWVQNKATFPSYEVQDRGLGVDKVEVTFEGKPFQGFSFDCAEAPNPCPRTVTQAQQPLWVETNLYGSYHLPTGLDWLSVTVSDPPGVQGVAGHTATAKVPLKVDHTAPEVALSGALTEQGSVPVTPPTP